MAALAAVTCAGDARAQGALHRFSLRGEIGAGFTPSQLQRERLGFDGAVVDVSARLGVDLVRWLSLQLSVNNGFFFAGGDGALGRTLAVQIGLRLQPALGTLGRAWIDVNPGYVSSGADRRFGLDVGLGVEFDLGRAFALGPAARIHWSPADPAVHDPSDLVYLSFGLSFSVRAPGPGPAPPVRDRDADGVVDDADRCPTTPAGTTPDPARRGCPVDDRDHDGVADDAEGCPDEAATPRPDPARRGCPLRDQDDEGLVDDDDLCPTTAPGARPDPSRRGCPEADRDHDGIPDDVDRCPDQPETVNQRDDGDGCPDRAVAGGRIRMSEEIRFRGHTDEMRRRGNAAILDEVAAIMRNTPEIAMLHVEAHTSERADPERNRALSVLRAAAVVRALVARGVLSSRLTPQGFGADRPRASGRPSAADARIEFRAIIDVSDAPPSAASTPSPPPPRP
ncbi:MAG: OmpA family protein [Polyangiales bacterium]